VPFYIVFARIAQKSEGEFLMSENIVSSVNAEPVASVEPHNEQVLNNEPVNAGEKGVAQPSEKPVQTPEENAKFAEMRRAREAAETKAATLEKNYQIAQKYGREYGVFSEEDIAANYSHLGITTMEQFEQAVERQNMINRGIDPDLLANEIENHPEVIRAREKEQQVKNFGEFEAWYTENIGKMPDLEKLPQPVLDAFFKGESMKTAFMDWDYQNYRQRIKVQEERAKAATANQANAASSTGSVKGTGLPDSGYISKEVFEANKGNQQWMMKNYDNLKKSMNKWGK
jgi:hypothetical protein